MSLLCHSEILSCRRILLPPTHATNQDAPPPVGRPWVVLNDQQSDFFKSPLAAVPPGCRFEVFGARPARVDHKVAYHTYHEEGAEAPRSCSWIHVWTMAR